MRIAIIDLGTNSIRFTIHQLEKGAKKRLLHQEKHMIRLGQGVFAEGKLDPHVIRRTVHYFSAFKRMAHELYVDKIIATATSAMREASNSNKLLELIQSQTGIDVRVISGLEEARLIALGILKNEELGDGRVGLIDVGGGSTEVSVCQNRKTVSSQSFPLGTARLQEMFLKSNPPPAENIARLRQYIRSTIKSRMQKKKWPKISELIGSSGTIRALTRMAKKINGGKFLHLEGLEELVEEMSCMTTTELLGLPGMEARRVDMILAGAILVQEFMEILKADQILPTDYSLRDGILAEQEELLKKHVTSQISFHLPLLFEKSKRFGADIKHLKKTAKMSELVFEKLKPLHHLTQDWQVYLTAATILRNTGEAISLVNHEKHSYYIVKHANFPSVEPWELEFVANLCFYHGISKTNLDNFPYKDNKQRRKVFLKLLALLLVIDGLDSHAQKTASIKKISVKPRLIKMTIQGGSSTDFEILRVAQKKDLFEKIFHKTLIVVRS